MVMFLMSIKKGAIFTCDLESWNDALHIPRDNHDSIEQIFDILYLLEKYRVRAIFYVLGKFKDEFPEMVQYIFEDGHILKTHGQEHYNWEEADRKPYAWLGFTGGFYFRFFPYWFIKWQVISNKHFYVHLHDLDEDHPQLKNPLMNWKRHVGLKGARKKLERLMREVEWDEPRD